MGQNHSSGGRDRRAPPHRVGGVIGVVRGFGRRAPSGPCPSFVASGIVQSGRLGQVEALPGRQRSRELLAHFLRAQKRDPRPSHSAVPEVASYALPSAFRACAMALRRMGEANIVSIAVTSGTPREGRTTVAVALAAAAVTELDKSTVVVDLDVKGSGISSVLPVLPGPGIVQIISGVASLDECLQPVGPKLAVLTLGGHQNSYDIATEVGSIGRVVEDLRTRCDVIVADLPPLGAGATTGRLADLFESVTLVVRTGGPPVPYLEHAATILSQVPFVILNHIPRKRFGWLLTALRRRPHAEWSHR